MILDPNDAVSGLYDLVADPGETTNRAAEPAQAGRVQRMRDRLLALRATERTAPIMELPAPLGPANGTMPFTPAADEGVFLWQDAAGGPLRLRANGAGSQARYEVTVLADRPFTAATAANLEAADVLAVDANTVRLTANASSWWDGVDLTLPDDADLTVQVTRNGAPAPQLLRLGAAAAPVASNAWMLPSTALPPAPSFRAGRDLGTFVGVSPSGPISVRLDGDGVAHRLTAELMASQPITATGVDVEGGDSFARAERAASLSGNVATWWDGFDVQAPPAGTTIALRVDEQGAELVHQVNPGPGNLGLPNARWIRR